MKTLSLLGCAWPQIPLVFDVAFETFGTRDFVILKNIPVDGGPELMINEGFYRFTIHEPGEWISLDGKDLAFGLTGPRAKVAVYNFFREKYNLQEQDLVNIIHPTSYIATSTRFSRGILVEPGVIVSSQARIGFGVTLKRGVNIGHNSEIGDFTEINPGVIVPGFTKIGRGCIIGVGSVLKNQITVGDSTYIGMGSVVTKDIPAGVIAYGNPCKVMRENTLWEI